MNNKLHGSNARLPTGKESAAKNPVKAIVTSEGIICANGKYCKGIPQPKEAYPKNGGSTCKICLNELARIKREENKDLFA